MKKKFGSISVGFYMVMSAMGNTLFNAVVCVLCGFASILTDVVNTAEKVGSVAGGTLSHAWDNGWVATWNFLHSHDSAEAAKTAQRIGNIQQHMDDLRVKAGLVPLQSILLDASQGL